MRIENEKKLDYADVLIRPKRSTLSSRKEVSLEREFKFPHTKKTWSGVPIIAANMDGVGTVSMVASLKKEKLITALHKYHDLKDFKNVDKKYAFVTIGVRDEDKVFLKKFIKKYGEPHLLCIDVANGYTEKFVDFVKSVREISKGSILMAGNVVTGDMTEQLILSGADIVKVGIGPGTVCTTRVVTGVGYPQLSAIIECADAAHGLKGLICADGGCRSSGDIAKAFGAGADFVMVGGMFAGHDESEEKIIEKNGEKFIVHYGSSSSDALEKHYGGKSSYRASEGKKILVPFKGPVLNTVKDILGGIRSACTYVGARQIKELPRRTTFILVNRQLSPSE
ncbi:MAG: GMP reductase [Minisyncoccia bacterium]